MVVTVAITVGTSLSFWLHRPTQESAMQSKRKKTAKCQAACAKVAQKIYLLFSEQIPGKIIPLFILNPVSKLI